MSGSRVVFNPVIEPATDATGADTITIGGSKYILKSGTEGTVTFVDASTLKVTTPAGKLDTKGLIIINPDKSATDIYNGIKYTIAKLPAPGNVIASILYDKYIKISWDAVANAKSYEIYAVIGSGSPFSIGTTQDTTFVYQDVKSNTSYKFIVKALGEYGLSNASITSNTVTTGNNAGPSNTDGGLNDNTVIKKSGNMATVTVGANDYNKNLTIDLTSGDLAQSKELVISMPAKVVANYYSKTITVKGNDFNLSFNPTVFNVDRIENKKNRSDTGIKFKIALNKEKNAASLSNEYVLSANGFVGKDSFMHWIILNLM